MNKFIFTLLFVATLLTNSQAQDTLSTITDSTLKEVYITYQAVSTTPVTFQNITANELDKINTGQEPSFILSQTPSITAYSDAGNTQGYSYYRIRGIDQTRINMTYDGMPLNEPEDQGAYFSNYPDILNSVSRMQIQRGVGTTQNGTSSYGGSIQLFSPNLYDSSKTTIGLGYGSYNSFRAFGEYNSGIKNKKGIYVRASQIYSDGYKYHSSNNSQSIVLSGGLYFDKTSWKINFIAGQQQNQLAWLAVSDSLINIDPRTNGNSKEKDKFTQALIQLRNTWYTGNNSTLNSGIFYTRLNGNYDFDLNNFLGLPSTTELYNYAFKSNFTGLYSSFRQQFNKLSWTTGIHGNLYNRQHTGSERAIGNLYRNTGYKNEISSFTKLEYSFKPINLFADIQYRYTSFEYEGSVALDKLNWYFLNPKAGISWQALANTTLYYGIGRTGREPTRTDIFGANDDLLSDSLGQAMIFKTNPEYVVDQELGIRRNSKTYILHLNLYYMNFKNEIVLDGNFGPNGLALTNQVDKSYRTGVEIYLNYKLNKTFSLINNSSFNHSRIMEQTEVFSPILTPAWIINQEINYSHNKLTFALTARYQSNSYIDFANTAKVNEYVLLNARIHYTLQKFKLTLYLNNITNQRYYNHGYMDFDGTRKYFIQAPFNVYSSVTYSF